MKDRPIYRYKTNTREVARTAAMTVGLVLLILVLLAGLEFLASWFLMLGIGIAHGSWWSTIPTMSFWVAFLIDFTIGTWIALQGFASRSSSKSK